MQQLFSSKRRINDGSYAVSYTHLDVYKRQVTHIAPARSTANISFVIIFTLPFIYYIEYILA